jgi:hypothetical protein
MLLKFFSEKSIFLFIFGLLGLQKLDSFIDTIRLIAIVKQALKCFSEKSIFSFIFGLLGLQKLDSFIDKRKLFAIVKHAQNFF